MNLNYFKFLQLQKSFFGVFIVTMGSSFLGLKNIFF